MAFCYLCSFMYASVSDISYIAEGLILGEGRPLGEKCGPKIFGLACAIITDNVTH